MKKKTLLNATLLSTLFMASILPFAHAADDGAGEGVNTSTNAVVCNDNCPNTDAENVTCTCGYSEPPNRNEPNRTPEEATESTDSPAAQNPAGTDNGSYF